jgi:hypothetical protein
MNEKNEAQREQRTAPILELVQDRGKTENQAFLTGLSTPAGEMGGVLGLMLPQKPGSHGSLPFPPDWQPSLDVGCDPIPTPPASQNGNKHHWRCHPISRHHLHHPGLSWMEVALACCATQSQLDTWPPVHTNIHARPQSCSWILYTRPGSKVLSH